MLKGFTKQLFRHSGATAVGVTAGVGLDYAFGTQDRGGIFGPGLGAAALMASTGAMGAGARSIANKINRPAMSAMQAARKGQLGGMAFGCAVKANKAFNSIKSTVKGV
jgi:hypothetical protein